MPRSINCALIVAFFGVSTSCRVLASSVVVPDEIASVQSAIDSGADTVLVREGIYDERVVINERVVLQGIGNGQRPRLLGLHIYNLGEWPNPPLLSVKGIDFAGAVTQTTVAIHPRNLQFSFSDCALDSGFIQVLSMDPNDVASLSFVNCRMRSSNARAAQVVMKADTVDGGVDWSGNRAQIERCWFRGGDSIGIRLINEPYGIAADNVIEDYAIGILVDGGTPFPVVRNAIRRCGTGIYTRSGWDMLISDNRLEKCGVGVYTEGGTNTQVLRNTIVDAEREGLRGFVANCIAEYNTITGAGTDGIVMEYPQDVMVGRNTIIGSAGSGIVANTPGGQPRPILVIGNIVSGSARWGLSVANVPAELSCNDWFGNGLGAANGVVPDSSDLNVDPRFCGSENADYRLDSSSPLLGYSSCGQIGALGVGCGVTATLLQRFVATRVQQGVRIDWEVAEGATASEIWLERSEALEGRGWTRPLMERSVEGTGVIQLDRSAALDRAYWYRLVGLEGGETVVIGTPIVVHAGLSPAFRMVEVGPNPGSGPLRVTFALKHAASIAIDVYDVQGRRVASPGRGSWPAGTHTLEWSGRTDGGDAAPAGLYFLRYQYPGGQDRRAIIRTR